MAVNLKKSNDPQDNFLSHWDLPALQVVTQLQIAQFIN